ncbi:DUF1989 domain-containing protein [Streptomyces rapamycinicus]|uniref:DUF1989 domain-containing protein n=1 Tax=Streptomyces rapamycinicus TaxID=1226757 RepID=UPI000418F108|nr:DUF1989 domain-containing protein [Streptomyces rapamycinicus]UTP28232.1 urea carboxylase-associated family protein [Streptomyces rapamycinicus NRRL 5491]
MSDHQRIAARTGAAIALEPGDRARIINTHGGQVVDTWAFVRTDPGVQADSSATRSLTREYALCRALGQAPALPSSTWEFPGVPAQVCTGCALGPLARAPVQLAGRGALACSEITTRSATLLRLRTACAVPACSGYAVSSPASTTGREGRPVMAITDHRGSARVGFGRTTWPRQYPPSADDDGEQASEPRLMRATGSSPWRGATQKDGHPHPRNFVGRLVIKGTFEPSAQEETR